MPVLSQGMQLKCAFFISVLFALAGTSAHASVAETPYANITFIGGGWRTANIRMELNTTSVNPDSCLMTDGYTTDTIDAGNQLFNSMLLTASTTKTKVKLILDGCVLSRPHIIGVYVQP